MSGVSWPQRPPRAAAPATARPWRVAVRMAGDLTRLRRQLHDRLRADPVPAGADTPDRERLLLAFEELASNGVRHGRPPVEVTVTADDTGWLLEVSDAAADRLPTPAVGRDPATGGLGLHLVAELAAGHGWTVAGDRKHVWARIDLPADAQLRGVLAAGADALGFAPVLQMTGSVDELPGDVLRDLLVVLREALTNVARHARAATVRLDLTITGDGVTVQVRDDGVGLAGAPTDGGLADLRRRAAWHGGALAVQPDPAGGTRLTWSACSRSS